MPSVGQLVALYHSSYPFFTHSPHPLGDWGYYGVSFLLSVNIDGNRAGEYTFRVSGIYPPIERLVCGGTYYNHYTPDGVAASPRRGLFYCVIVYPPFVDKRFMKFVSTGYMIHLNARSYTLNAYSICTIIHSC